MRTTFTLDDDLAGGSFKEAVNQAIRSGLGSNAHNKSDIRPKTVPHSFGFKPGIDLDKLNQLVDELEAEETATRIMSGTA